MSRQTPYLQRRGYGLTFRIAVPPDLRSLVGMCEITKAISTSNKDQAFPIALEYAACAKHLFGELRIVMDSKKDHSQPVDQAKVLKLMQEMKHRLQLDDRQIQHEDELLAQHRLHKQELEQTRLTVENEVMRRVLAGHTSAPAPAPIP